MMWIGTVARKIGRILPLTKLRGIELQDLKGHGVSCAGQIATGSWASAPEVGLCHSFIRPD